MPDLPEFCGRSANSFRKVSALPRAFSARSVCSGGFLAARATHLCKNDGSWGGGQKARAAALQGLWLQLLTQALFFKNSTVDLSRGLVQRALTPRSKRRLGAASAVARSVFGYGQDAQEAESREPCTSSARRC